MLPNSGLEPATYCSLTRCKLDHQLESWAPVRLCVEALCICGSARGFVDEKSISMFSGSMNSNMAIMLCQLLFFNVDATFYVLLLHYLNTAVRNNATCGFLTLQSYLISVSSNDIALV